LFYICINYNHIFINDTYPEAPVPKSIAITCENYESSINRAIIAIQNFNLKFIKNYKS